MRNLHHLLLLTLSAFPFTTLASSSDEPATSTEPMQDSGSTFTFVMASSSVTEEAPKFKLSPTGVVLVDGALYAPDGDGFSDGMSIPDVRLGLKGSYGNWSGRIDIGFGYGKLSMKDIYLQYTFTNTNNYLRAGYFVHQFGLNAATSSTMKPTGESATSDDFTKSTGRNLGISFVLDRPKFFMGVSGITATGGIGETSGLGRTSIGALGRFVYRPFASTGKVLQIGVSPWYQSPLHKATPTGDGHTEMNAGYFSFSANFPTRVSTVEMLGTGNIEDARGVFKLTPEWLLSYDRFALEGQYYFMNVARHNMKSYSAQGVYTYLRGLIFGQKSYGYSHGDAGLATPADKTLECVLGYNYTDGNKNGIKAGITNDYSVTFNYYINKYFLARLAYHYTDVRNSAVTFDRHVNIVQIRLQAKF